MDSPRARQTKIRPKARSVPDPLSPRLWWAVLREAVSSFLSHGMGTQGAALAYYSLFALGPLMLLSISIAGVFFGAEAVRGQVSTQLAGLVGERGAKGIEALLAGVGRPSEGFLTGLIGAVAMLAAAVTVVITLKDALNLAWGADARPASGVLGFIRKYAVSLAGVLAIGFLLLVSLVITALLAAMAQALSGYFHAAQLQALNIAVSILVSTVLFALMFEYLPDVDVGLRDVVPGAFVTALLFELGKFLIGFYIGRQGIESTYGAAASLVVVLVWVYYSSQLVLFGAEITRAYADRERAVGPRRRRPDTSP